MVKLTITYINRTERTSQRTNKPFTSVSLKCQEYGDKYLSGFGNRTNSTWEVGDVVEVAEVKEVQKDGKTYLNFEMPKFDVADLSKRVETLENAMSKVKLILQKHEDKLFPQAPVADSYPSPEKVGLPEDNLANFEPKTAAKTAEEEFNGLDDGIDF